MNPYNSGHFLFALLAFVAFLPPWFWFMNSHPAVGALSMEAHFFAQLVLPAAIVLFLASWASPGGS